MKRLLTPLSAALAALAVLAGALFTAPPAFAVSVVSHGYGHLWAADGRSWLGSHLLDDGNLGLCLQLTKAPPEGSSIGYISGNSLGWYSRDDTPRLAYLGRNWLLSHDPIEASAAQLAAWSITGLGSHDDAYYAQRANGDAAAVLDRARQMRAIMDGPGGASRSVTATVNFADIAGSGGAGATVQSDLFVDFLSGGVTRLDPDLHAGTITLTGATFDDGSTSRSVSNGEKYTVHPIADTPASEIIAETEYSQLPYGDAFWVAGAPSTVQTLLVPPATLAEARASTSALVSTDLPFFPAVSTQTSAQTAVTGAAIHDTLDLALATPPVEVPRVAAGAATPAAASADAASSANAPSTKAPAASAPSASAPSASAPAANEPAANAPSANDDAPRSTDTSVGSGVAGSAAAGSAAADSAVPNSTTPNSELPSSRPTTGDSTDSDRAESEPPSAGPGSAGPGTEGTEGIEGIEGIDRLDQWGTYTAADGQVLPIPVTIRSTLLGPLDSAPTPAPQPPDGSGVVCRVETVAEQGPARYTTPDCVLPAPGFYVWVETIDPADTAAEKGGARVRPWRSPFGTATEVTSATTPPPPPAPPAPPTSAPPNTPNTTPGVAPVQPPKAGPPATLPHDLASTGSQGVPWWLAWGVASLIAAGLAARLVSKHERFHRRRR
jgi:hypothetical protein